MIIPSTPFLILTYFLIAAVIHHSVCLNNMVIGYKSILTIIVSNRIETNAAVRFIQIKQIRIYSKPLRQAKK